MARIKMLKKKITKKLQEKFPDAEIEVQDFSSEHYGHDAGGAHVQVEVFDESFEGKSLPEQHRVIYEVLDTEMKDGSIHALKIKTGIKQHE